MDQKKFGTFAGVFTPSILTILGVMMYLRFGQVVGNAGLWGSIIIIIIAHVISISTGLSVSSIATDKKVGAGGVYYVLSRSLGLPIGGSLGTTLFVATAFSIALYMVGFAEVFISSININMLEVIGEGDVKTYFIDDPGSFFDGWSFINFVRLIASLGLLLLTIIALISTSIAIKTQFLILALIIISLVAIGIGDVSLVTNVTKDQVNPDNLLDYFGVFALFFPAVTGFTAGVAMSGDLKDPKRSIPRGTMWSIIVGFIIYMALALFIHFNFSEHTLIENRDIFYEITLFGGIFVILGAAGATLSSALGGILGGPRILQAMSIDKITPKLFAKGVGKDNEPRNALILTVIIAEAGILIGELNLIAEIVSMFYLAAYGFINLSFFLESWASADFNPSFKVKKWIGLIGFIATFTIMSQLNMLAMVAAFVIIVGIYFYLNKKQVSLGTGDIWQSVWSTIVKKGLRKMEASNDHKRNWKPNILLFSGGTADRVKFIEFSKAVSGQTGIITNFDLIENTEAKVLFPKHKQTVQDDDLEKYGIFGRRIEVQNEFKGIESIASTFGFSGIEPNTTLIPWPGETKDPVWFTEMTQKLIDLDYNVLYLDYDKRWGFRKKEQIDLWWRGVSNHAELMLSLVKFISTSTDWVKASIRILLVNDTNTENQIIEKRIQQVVDQFRIKCQIKIISNSIDQIPIYELMKIHSEEADLVFVSIPEITDPESFIQKTNELVNTIGTTLLVKASSHFDETDLKVETIELKQDIKVVKQTEQQPLATFRDSSLTNTIQEIDTDWDNIFVSKLQKSVENIEKYLHKQIAKNQDQLTQFLDQLVEESETDIWKDIDEILNKTKQIYIDDIEFQLPDIYQEFNQSVDDYIFHKTESIIESPVKINLENRVNNKGENISRSTRIRFRKYLERLWETGLRPQLHQQLLEFGYQNYILLHQSKNTLHHAIRLFVDQISQKQDFKTSVEKCKEELSSKFSEIDERSLNLTSELYKNLRNSDRALLEKLGGTLEKLGYRREIQEKFTYLPSAEEKHVSHGLTNFSGYWNRNLVLFTLHLQSDIYLIQYMAKIEKILSQVIQNTEHDYINLIHENIEICHQNINNITNLINTGKTDDIHQYSPDLLRDIYFNLEGSIQYVLEQLQDALDHIPEEVELMNAHSVNNIRKTQGKSVETIKIQLDDITDYLTKIHFFKPFQDQITNYIVQLKKGVALLLNSTYKIQLELENFAKTNEMSPFQTAIESSTKDLEESKDYIDSVHKGFIIELNLIKANLGENLDINKIIEQYETLYPEAKSESKSKRIRGQIKQYRSSVTKRISSVVSKVVQRKQDVDVLDYNDKYKAVLSPINIFQNFFNQIHINDEVSETLPFYYHQLFTGKHFSDTQSVKNRKHEIEETKKAISRIKSGISGGILVLGESLSGKSFLASHIAHHLLSDRTIYRIKLQRNKKKGSQFLTKAFQNATGIQKGIPTIMTKVPSHSIFIIEDLEKWWLNAQNGDQLINEISRILNTYGSSHYFVLTANLYAYRLIKDQTHIGENIVGSILLNPLSNIEIRDVIEGRHLLGGMTYVYRNVPENFLSKSKQVTLLNKFYTLSKGNVGLALRLWISSIENVDENKIEISPASRLEFPVLPNEIWQSLIYQFQVHQQLYKHELYKIYGDGNKDWINRNLTELVKSGLLRNPEKDFYEMPSDVRYFIEKDLYE